MPLPGVLCPGGDVAFLENRGLVIREPELNDLVVPKMRFETRWKRNDSVWTGEGVITLVSYAKAKRKVSCCSCTL